MRNLNAILLVVYPITFLIYWKNQSLFPILIYTVIIYIYILYIIVLSLEIVGEPSLSHVFFFPTVLPLLEPSQLSHRNSQVCRDQPLDGGLPPLVLGFSTTSAWPALCIALRQQLRPCGTLRFFLLGF